MSLTITRVAAGVAACMGLLLTGAATADEHPQAGSLLEAATGGKAYGQLRPRYEFVDEENFTEDAHAFTLRTRLGYRTADWNRFGVVVEMEDVRAFGSEDFNSTVNGHTRYPVVLDPESTEVNQVFLAYSGLADTTLQLGRQYISFDNERWVGPVGWRQNSVSMDAFTVSNRSLSDTTIFYGYVDNVNRLFGEDHPTFSDWDMDTHLVNVAYSGLAFVKIVGYGYFLDFQDPAFEALSTRTLGLRLDGDHAINEAVKLLYTAEYADQSDHADGRPRDADYYWVTLGLGFKGISVKLNQEQLSGNGDFTRGLDRWFFAVDQDMPWHIWSMPVAIVFDLGWLGLAAFAALLGLGLTRTTRQAFKGDPLAGATLGSLLGVLVITTVDTIIDAPRFLLLLLLLTCVGCGPRRPRPLASA